MANAFFRLGHRTMHSIIRGNRVIASSISRGFAAAGRVLSFKHDSPTRRVLVVTVASAFIGAFALPGYAFVEHTENVVDDGQVIIASASDSAIELANFKITSAAALARQGFAIEYPTYTGPTVEDFLKNPPLSNDYSMTKVMEVAYSYQGVPYRFGGASPAGFDCSGYVQFVYSQFGIALPHGVMAQAALGKPIKESDALPGDLVIMPGHNGFYAGNGMILDSPRAGGVVAVRKIWTTNYYIVRLGI